MRPYYVPGAEIIYNIHAMTCKLLTIKYYVIINEVAATARVLTVRRGLANNTVIFHTDAVSVTFSVKTKSRSVAFQKIPKIALQEDRCLN